MSEIAGALGGHPNTARHHLRRLVEDGLATAHRETPHGRGRPGMLFRATIAGRGALRPSPGAAMGHYLSLAGAFAARLSQEDDPRAVSREVGHSWGETLVATEAEHPPEVLDGAGAAIEGPDERVADMLDRLGFAPEPLPEAGRYALTQCPLLDAAKRHPDVVCEVHAGLIEAAHAAFGGDGGTARLEAFARPGSCILTLPGASLAAPQVPHDGTPVDPSR